MIKYFFLMMCQILVITNQNFQSNVSEKEFQKIIKKYPNVLVGFVDDEEKGQDIEKTFEKLAQNHLNEESLFFVTIQIYIITKDTLEKYDITHTNEIHFYLNGFRKKLSQSNNIEDIEYSFHQIKISKPIKIQDNQEEFIKKNPYFVYCNNEMSEQHQDTLTLLSQLIYPSQIFFGFKKDQEKEFIKNQKEQLFIYQDYDNKLIGIDTNQDPNQIAKFIQENQFPSYVVPNKKSLKLIFQQEIPVLIFFNAEEENPLIDILKMMSKQYHEYLMLMIIDYNKIDLNIDISYYLKEFMGVTHAPALRILEIGEKIKRYKFIGTLEDNAIDYFLQNYLYGNLVNYKINQHITQIYSKGIMNLNSDYFENEISKSNKNFIIFIYSGLRKNKRFKQIQKLYYRLFDTYQDNQNLVFSQIDFDQNSIGNRNFKQLPKIMLVKNDGYFGLFQEKYSLENLSNFLEQNFENLKKRSFDDL